MRTTVRLDDGLLRRVKAEASKRGETVTALVERGLRLVMAGSSRATRPTRVTLPVSRRKGGTRPGVDLNNSTTLFDILEGRG
jgi:hypothetical protein